MKKHFITFKQFLRSVISPGVLLVTAVLLSLIIANTGLHQLFDHVLSRHVGFTNASVDLDYSILEWINDGLMSFFFLLVGLEIKDEFISGELSDRRSASLPIFAALGGMLVPAVVYSAINHNTSTASGWGIPMATDIAFVVAVIEVLAKSVPLSLQIFIKALAVVDDLGAIIVIAIFYASGLSATYLMLALSMFLLQIAFNYFNVKRLMFYLIPGIFMWYFIHHSGIHATVAGVLTAMAVPESVKRCHYSPLKKLIRGIEHPVNFIIVPLFALVNSNISISGDVGPGNMVSPLTAGILFGLLLGKPVGITLFSFAAVKLRLSKLAEGVRWSQMWGIGQLAGIGFTMSIFMALLSFSDPTLQSTGKLSILLASVSSAVLGYLMLRKRKISP